MSPSPNTLGEYLRARRELVTPQQAGIPGTIDYNGPVYEGVGYLQHNVRRGRRRHAADNYLLPAMKRANLRIESEALAQRVLMEGRKAVGVVYRKGTEERTVRARREVLLAATEKDLTRIQARVQRASKPLRGAAALSGGRCGAVARRTPRSVVHLDSSASSP